MGLLNRFRRGRDDEPVNLDERSPQLGIRYRDLLLMNEIAKQSDLSQPRHVRYFLYAPNGPAAQAMHDQALARGLDATMHEPSAEHLNQWPVVCETHAVLTPDFVRESGDFFEALADTHQAEYDGWEAAMS